VVDIEGLKIDLGTLGGTNSWIWWDGINDRGVAVGFAETAVSDPNARRFSGAKLHPINEVVNLREHSL
jgi:hypothetical protein